MTFRPGNRPRGSLWCWSAVLVLSCSAGLPVGTSPAQPLLLPWQWTARGTGLSISLWAFGVTTVAEPAIVGTNGIVQSFSWEPQGPVTPALAREVEVVTSSSNGTLSFVADGASSNGVDVLSMERVTPRAPESPQLIPWREGSASVLIIAAEFGSGRLVTPAGEPLPEGSWTCERADDALRAIAMRCTVLRRGPLSGVGYGGSTVRAIVSSPTGPLLTPVVRLP
jgi:hypothetical protein